MQAERRACVRDRHRLRIRQLHPPLHHHRRPRLHPRHLQNRYRQQPTDAALTIIAAIVDVKVLPSVFKQLDCAVKPESVVAD